GRVLLVCCALASGEEAGAVLPPELRTDRAATELVLIDLGRGKHRLGGSQLAQVHGQIGDQAPHLDDPAALRAFFTVIQSLNRDGLVLAYHDRSDGGLFAAVCEM